MRTGIAAIVLVVACGKGGGEDKGKAEQRTNAARATEAEVHLRSLQKELDTYVAEMAKLPVGEAPLTPPKRKLPPRSLHRHLSRSQNPLQ